MQPVPNAGKHATGVKRGNKCNRCQARENMLPVLSAGKRATGAKLIDSKQQYVGSHWLEHVIQKREKRDSERLLCKARKPLEYSKFRIKQIICRSRQILIKQIE